MYYNIGGKIKLLAIIWTVIGILASFLIGGTMATLKDELVPLGLLVIALGSVLAWLSSLLFYAFGELVERVCHIDNTLSGTSYDKQNSLSAKLERISKKANDTTVAPANDTSSEPVTDITVERAPSFEEKQQLRMLFLQGKITEEEYYELTDGTKDYSK